VVTERTVALDSPGWLDPEWRAGARALSYRRSLLDATPSARARHGDGVPGWLVDLGAPGSLDRDSDVTGGS
jgi:hypothetical protein